jgi:hypothetical protein
LELALNLGWVVLSAAFVGFFLCLVTKRSERSELSACIALVCVLCLLFPVISMTDDLNSSPAIPEATKAKQLLPAAEFVVRLFSHVVIPAPPDRVWATLAFEPGQKLIRQEVLCFDLSRRPPPVNSLLSIQA